MNVDETLFAGQSGVRDFHRLFIIISAYLLSRSIDSYRSVASISSVAHGSVGMLVVVGRVLLQARLKLYFLHVAAVLLFTLEKDYGFQLEHMFQVRPNVYSLLT